MININATDNTFLFVAFLIHKNRSKILSDIFNYEMAAQLKPDK